MYHSVIITLSRAYINFYAHEVRNVKSAFVMLCRFVYIRDALNKKTVPSPCDGSCTKCRLWSNIVKTTLGRLWLKVKPGYLG